MKRTERELSWHARLTGGVTHLWGWRDVATWTFIICAVAALLAFGVRVARADLDDLNQYAIWDLDGIDGPINRTTSGWSTTPGLGAGALGGSFTANANLRIATLAFGVPASNGIGTTNWRLYWFDTTGPNNCPGAHGSEATNGSIAIGSSAGWYEHVLSSSLEFPSGCSVVLVLDYPASSARWERSAGVRSHHSLDMNSGFCFGATGSACPTPNNGFNGGFDLTVYGAGLETPTPTLTPTATSTPTPTPTRTPTPTPTPPPTPAGTPVGTLGPSSHVWVDNLWEIAQPIRDLPVNMVNALATLVVPEPTMIARALQTAEAGTGQTVVDAQATAYGRWETTVDLYTSKTAFVTEIGGTVGEIKNALLNQPCGSTPFTISVTLMGNPITLEFFTQEQLDVWWCPVFKPLLEAAMYALFSVSAIMLWLRLQRSRGNE